MYCEGGAWLNCAGEPDTAGADPDTTELGAAGAELGAGVGAAGELAGTMDTPLGI